MPRMHRGSAMSLEFEDKIFVLRKCFFEVQNEVGKGRNIES